MPRRNRKTRGTASPALLFAALGDQTRLALVARLGDGRATSITQLTEGPRLTRQAVTKHLHVLESAGIVSSERDGREQLFRLDPRPMHAMQRYLDHASRQWDQALARLKSFVEE